MLYVELDQFGKIRMGVSSSNSYYTGRKKNTVNFSFDITNSGTAVVYKAEDNIKYRAVNHNYNIVRSIQICRTNEGIMKFKFNDIDGNLVSVLYPTNNDPSLDNSTVIGNISFNSPGSYPILFIRGQIPNISNPVQTQDIYQVVYGTGGGLTVEDDESFPTTYLKHEFTLNELDLDTKVQITDLADTTSDLISETAAKYVAR